MCFKSIPVLLMYCAINIESAKILGIFHVPSYSHNILGQTLLKALAERGHQVTMVSPFPLETPMPNYEDIYVDNILKYHQEVIVKIAMDAENLWLLQRMGLLGDNMHKMCEAYLKEKVVKDLLNANRTFDLVIIDYVLSDVMVGFAHHFNAACIGLSSTGSYWMTNKVTMNPTPYSYVPNLVVTSTDEMTFLGRLANTAIAIFMGALDRVTIEKTQDEMLHRYFPNAPPINELMYNISLVFLNSHFSIETPRPYVPNLVHIGGIHIKKPKKLELELQRFMDEASEGVLYFSLGGNANSSKLTKEKLDSIITTFQKLPIKVVWKLERSDLSLPPNVKIEKWLPQTDVLAHPNLKVFVTHGGLLSTIESIYRGVPMVGVPLFGDQQSNVELNVAQGYSTIVTLDDLTEETFTNAIMEVLNNPKYMKNVKQRSALFNDQLVEPLDTAVYWVEYVLRHRGAPHLKTAAHKLQWHQYYLLDVIAFLAIVLACALYILSKLVIFICKLGKNSNLKKKNL